MKLARYVKFRAEEFGGVLFETRAEQVFTLNPAAAAIVREIQEGGEEDDIVAHLKQVFRDPYCTIEHDSLRFIADLKQRGLVSAE